MDIVVKLKYIECVIFVVFFCSIEAIASNCPHCAYPMSFYMFQYGCTNPFCPLFVQRRMANPVGNLELNIQTPDYSFSCKGAGFPVLHTLPIIPYLSQKNAQPKMPQIPQIPQMPQMPQMPQISQMPQMPQISQMPQIPQSQQLALASTTSKLNPDATTQNSEPNRAMAAYHFQTPIAKLINTLETLLKDFGVTRRRHSELNFISGSYYHLLRSFAATWTSLSRNRQLTSGQMLVKLCEELGFCGIWPPDITSEQPIFDNSLDTLINSVSQNNQVFIAFYTENNPFIMLHINALPNTLASLPAIQMHGIYQEAGFDTTLSLDSLRHFLFLFLHAGNQEFQHVSILIFKIVQRSPGSTIERLQLTDN